MHEAEGDLLCKSTNEIVCFVNPQLINQVPYFNAPVYLENKTKIGKVDEILGAVSDVHFSMKCDEGLYIRVVYDVQVSRLLLSKPVIRYTLIL